MSRKARPFRWLSPFLSLLFLYSALSSCEGVNSTLNSDSLNVTELLKIPLLYDSSSTDAEFQKQLLNSVLVSFQSVDANIQPLLIDLSYFGGPVKDEGMRECVKSLISNGLQVILSLLERDDLQRFSEIYEDEMGEGGKAINVYTPRLHNTNRKFRLVLVKSLEMSEDGRAIALLNRAKKVGVETLIPILDGDSPSQMDLLKAYHKSGLQAKHSIKFTKPIYLNDPIHSENLEKILRESNNIHEKHLLTLGYHKLSFQEALHTSLKPGILLLAKNSSQLAMQIASKKNHLLLSWFSPNIMEFEEWAYKQVVDNENSAQAVSNERGPENSASPANNSLFGLYTVSFVGSKGWDNPLRRKMLREFTTFTGPSPRILSAVLTYDAVSLARDHLRNELHLPKMGLSGLIEFNKEGHRKSGAYLGTSSVPKTSSSEVTLLQPSTWILEDVTTIKENAIGSHYKLSDYDVATSSILNRNELLEIVNSTRYEQGCAEHLMNVVTYDPFNQMPYHYFFNEANLPETMVVPNHQGFGITFVCTHKAGRGSNEVSSLQLACTPGIRMMHPVNCFTSHINRRQKRATSTGDKGQVPSVQYQYSLSGNDPWLTQNGNYYYQSAANRDYNPPYDGYLTTRVDVAAASEEPPTTPAPATPAAPPKLPELRQVLKALKPFIGSCIGSSTGCAICVLVLGRLPLGTAPTACTGPCFVGTFGSCGSLLGRVFAETTVICTELFRQGLLDPETFVADAEFGRYMLDSSPYTYQGYTLLATPLVTVMKSSSVVTKIVATFALPWAHHMKYILGRSNETDMIGSAVHLIGYPLCNLTGRIYFFLTNIKINLISYLLLLSPILSVIMTILLILTLVPTLSATKSKKSTVNLQSLVLFCGVVMSRLKFYLMAMGRRT